VSFYHDDPVDESRHRGSIFSSAFALVLLLAGGIFFLQSTLAANISLNSGRTIEFGQAVSQAVACSGSQNVTVAPKSSFVNAANGTGTYYLSEITVGNIPTSCNGVNFKLSAYGSSSSTPLAIFNSTSTEAIVNYNAANVSLRQPKTGISLSGGNGTFTITFTTPVAQSTSVAKVTIQSGLGTDQTYEFGERGPGGGIVFYVAAANFSSPGSACGTSCKYLEVAPSTWQSAGATVANDANYVYSNNTTVASAQDNITAGTESGLSNGPVVEKFNWKIGQGFYNTSVMKVSGATSTAQAAVLAYAGSSVAGQWFLPSMNELNELCKYARGQATGVPTVACVTGSGTFKSTVNAGGDLGGFVSDFYLSSTESNTNKVNDALNIRFSTGALGTYVKTYAMAVRPIRAF
jgi:hypothetical protein